MQQPLSTHSSSRGRLIVFEGIDGTGKSTQVQLLAQDLQGRGYEVVCGFEPTRGPWGMRVRNAALANERLSIDEEIDCLLQDRREHVKRVIEPALARGAWVLLDRYYLSMMAYQGASGANVELIREMNEEFAPIPDLAFWLDQPVEESLNRITTRGDERDAFEQENFLSRVSLIYSQMEMPWLFRIDADMDVQDVNDRIQDLIREEL